MSWDKPAVEPSSERNLLSSGASAASERHRAFDIHLGLVVSRCIRKHKPISDVAPFAFSQSTSKDDLMWVRFVIDKIDS